MNFGLKGKVAVITGSTRGIGLAIAKQLAQEGVSVVINGSSSSSVNKACENLKSQGINVLGFPADVSKENDIRELADYAIKEYNSIDIWINNAGTVIFKLLEDMSEHEWDRIYEVNLKGVFLGCKVASNIMKKQRNGVIINATSFSAIIPRIGGTAYAATKAAVISLTRGLAGELAPYNIRVNAYMPGPISTEMLTDNLQPEEMIEQISMQRLGKPEEVASVVMFLASELASFITGEIINISGGKLIVQNPKNVWSEFISV